MSSAKDIQQNLSKNLNSLIAESFPQLANTSIGNPIPLFDNSRKQQYWLVPLLLKTKVRGSVLLDLNGGLVTYGVLNPNVQDEQKLLDNAYLEKVPDKILEEVKDFYKEYQVSSQYFSYDVTPKKWGWLISLKSNSSFINVFVGPSGWYEIRTVNELEG